MLSAKTLTPENNDSALWKVRQRKTMGKFQKYCINSE